MKQQIICGFSETFHSAVAKMIEDGWLVFGNIATTQENYTWKPSFSYQKTELRAYYTVIMQKDGE